MTAIKEHHDTRKQDRQTLWIITWKVRDVYVDNGERIARENRDRVLDRIRALEERLKNWSIRSFTKRVKSVTSSLSQYEPKKIQLEKEQQTVKQVYDQAEQKFDAIIHQIDAIYRSSGTVNVKSIKTVDELCLALQTGSRALISACEKIQSHLAKIDVDPKSLVDAVLDGLQLINMADDYNDSTKIKDIKRVLALE